MLITIEDALTNGQGTERPITCPEHEDRNASASLNVLKGVWYCYACHAAGGIDKKHVPSAENLASMLQPETNPRIYPEVYLDLFDGGTYWPSRFPDWLCWFARLGHDPFTGNDTFPVRTPQGRLAGVGIRQTNEAVEKAKEAGGNPARYKYPYGWSASTVLGGMDLVPRSPVLVIVEGYADACSLWEVGVPAVCGYGSSLHLPQIEHIHRRNPSVVLLGQDMDEAGHRGAERSHAWLKDSHVGTERITWPKNDPAECTPMERLEAVLRTVAAQEYGLDTAWIFKIKADYMLTETT